MRKHHTEGEFLGTTRPLKIRWVMISFAIAATVLNYLHRLSFNYLAANDYLRDLIPEDELEKYTEEELMKYRHKFQNK